MRIFAPPAAQKCAPITTRIPLNFFHRLTAGLSLSTGYWEKGIRMKNETCASSLNDLTKQTGQLKPWQIQRAEQLMLDNLDSDISVAAIAQACALSRSHFTRQFKRSTLVSPKEWMREQRILRGKQLLQTSRLLIADIALECGFSDQSHFCRTFVRTEGVTPRAWKQNNQSPAL
ncbi:AraC family transcriptional regulator [Pseudomonas sp. IAC-BECa141]|uniref:AraC family transcriptional regulator n=1 Tax=Pseudomonas sp. IAC-BECa141 TaxID=2793103 RepID=UPI0029CA6110|nr:AraC family transcriptional regulator [Pseudomonas sp. IAC-BECa141]